MFSWYPISHFTRLMPYFWPLKLCVVVELSVWGLNRDVFVGRYGETHWEQWEVGSKDCITRENTKPSKKPSKPIVIPPLWNQTDHSPTATWEVHPPVETDHRLSQETNHQAYTHPQSSIPAFFLVRTSRPGRHKSWFHTSRIANEISKEISRHDPGNQVGYQYLSTFSCIFHMWQTNRLLGPSSS